MKLCYELARASVLLPPTLNGSKEEEAPSKLQALITPSYATASDKIDSQVDWKAPLIESGIFYMKSMCFLN